MLELHTLGVLDLRGPDSADTRAVLQQPKRLALLAYLAGSHPRRYHRRDTLLNLFWGELDQARARASLRRSIYFLRQALGADTIVSRGEDEIAVEESALWCDAAALEGAVAAGRLADALELYRGEFLDGVYVREAPEFMRWLDDARARFRTAATTAARTLAQRAERDGDLPAAASWSRRLLALAPDDEAAVGTLIAALDRLGDRTGALAAFDVFSRRLREAYDLEPSVATQGLVERVRARPERLAAAAPDVIAVFPFTLRGDQRLGYLREGMVDLLATSLDGGGVIRAVEPRALLAHVTREGWTEIDHARASEGAARLGAARYVLGTVVEAGGRLQAAASLCELGGTVRAQVQSQGASEASLFEVVDELARQLLSAATATAGDRPTRLAALTTASLPALKAYLAGEQHLRAGRYFDAMEALERAVQEDPAFALAQYRLASAAAGCALPELAREISQRAAAHRDRLGEHDRQLLDAQSAWLRGDAARAEACYTSITGHHPDDVEAWFLLGDLLFHANPLRGRSATEARGPFERALHLEPEHVGSLTHLMRIAALEGRRDDALALAERVQALSPAGDQALAMRAFRAFGGGDAGAIREVLEELQQARALTVAIAFADVALYANDLNGAETIARSFLRVARSDELKALCRVLLAHLALARGRWRGAFTELAEAWQHDRAWGLTVTGLFAAMPFVPMPPAEVAAVLTQLEAWDASGIEPSFFAAFAMHNGAYPLLRAYLIGLLRARLGDATGARRAADEIDRADAPGPVATLAVALAPSVRAAAARSEGNPRAALDELEAADPDLWFQLTVASPFYSLAYERFIRAELLAELGQRDEALGWLASLAQRSPYELVYTAPAERHRGELLSAGGRSREAAAAWRRFAALWRTAEPELEPFAAEALRRAEAADNR